MSVQPNIPISPSVCLSRQLCLTFVFLRPPITHVYSSLLYSQMKQPHLSVSLYIWTVEEAFHLVVLYIQVHVKHGVLQRDVCVSLCVRTYEYLCNFLGLCTAPIGSEGRRRSREEEEEEALKRKQLHEEHLSKVSEITLCLRSMSYMHALCHRL